jgi:DegV family protein with EDD domain
MRAQHRTASQAEGDAIITDSGADLPREVCERLDIHMVPVRVNFGEEDFLDKVSISPSEFYARLRRATVLPQTSQPPPGDFRRQFEFLLTHHPRVLYAGISRAVSGTLQSGESAAQRVDAARVRVVDTGHASCGQGLVLIALAEAARAGADSDALVALAQRLRGTTHTFAAARDISFAVRGGRVPAWTLPIARLLRVTPVARMRADGKLGVHGALWGRDDAPRRFAAYVVRHVPRGKRWRVLVGHCDCAADGESLLTALRERLDCSEGSLVEAGPAIGAHAGPQTLVVALQEVDALPA